MACKFCDPSLPQSIYEFVAAHAYKVLETVQATVKLPEGWSFLSWTSFNPRLGTLTIGVREPHPDGAAEHTVLTLLKADDTPETLVAKLVTEVEMLKLR